MLQLVTFYRILIRNKTEKFSSCIKLERIDFIMYLVKLDEFFNLAILVKVLRNELKLNDKDILHNPPWIVI